MPPKEVGAATVIEGEEQTPAISFPNYSIDAHLLYTWTIELLKHLVLAIVLQLVWISPILCKSCDELTRELPFPGTERIGINKNSDFWQVCKHI